MTFDESVLALHAIPGAICGKEEEPKYMHAYFGDVARFYHPYHIVIFSLNQGIPIYPLFFSKEKI